MRNIFTLFLCVGALGFGCTSKKDNRISIGSIDSVYSDVLKEQRRIWVHLPESSKSSKAKYPVVYLLDGDSHFHSVTGVLQQLSDNQVTPEMIVVAIPNTDRSRDLTPSHALRMPDGKEADFLKSTGGAENFTAFIEKELMPYVDAHYPTAPHRILIGHSFGGIFAINTLINHPQLFNSYISIDPSMWWDESRLLNHADSVFKDLPLKNRTLFLGVANTMSPGMDTARVASDTSRDISHIKSILHFAKVTAVGKDNGLRFGWKYYDNDDHGSVPLISEYDGFRFLFDYFKPKVKREDITVDALKAHAQLISERMGYVRLPDEATVNALGYMFLQLNQMDKSESFFKLNVENYPTSQNVFDSMGDLYLAKGDTVKAKESWTKALTISEGVTTRKKLEAIK